MLYNKNRSTSFQFTSFKNWPSFGYAQLQTLQHKQTDKYKETHKPSLLFIPSLRLLINLLLYLTFELSTRWSPGWLLLVHYCMVAIWLLGCLWVVAYWAKSKQTTTGLSGLQMTWVFLSVLVYGIIFTFYHL